MVCAILQELIKVLAQVFSNHVYVTTSSLRGLDVVLEGRHYPTNCAENSILTNEWAVNGASGICKVCHILYKESGRRKVIPKFSCHNTDVYEIIGQNSKWLLESRSSIPTWPMDIYKYIHTYMYVCISLSCFLCFPSFRPLSTHRPWKPETVNGLSPSNTTT